MNHGNGSTIAILLGVYATFALDVYSTLNSSPQTTELFAHARKDSLMYWVSIGSGVAIVGGIIASITSKSIYPLLATGFVALGMHGLYKHAVSRGTENGSLNLGRV